MSLPHHHHPLHALGNISRGRQNYYKSQRWWVALRKQCFPDITGLMHLRTHRDHDSIRKSWTSSSQTKFSTEMGKWVQSPIPNKKAICSWYLLRGKMHFLQWSEELYGFYVLLCLIALVWFDFLWYFFLSIYFFFFWGGGFVWGWVGLGWVELGLVDLSSLWFFSFLSFFKVGKREKEHEVGQTRKE